MQKHSASDQKLEAGTSMRTVRPALLMHTNTLQNAVAITLYMDNNLIAGKTVTSLLPDFIL